MKLSDLVDGVAMSEDWASVDITGVTADSRAAKPGYLFAALAGGKTDGARYIADAVRNGAAAVLAHDAAVIPEDVAAPVLRDPNPRRRFALMAARLNGAQPETVAAVTGTNGKTSVASFLRQIWTSLGRKAASLGTVGLVSPAGETPLEHTTPDPAALHAMLAELAAQGVDALAVEASSHGLAQHRLDGVRLAATAFTNITRDHLDYHGDFEAYLRAKLRLFEDLAPPGAPAVVYADDDHAAHVAGAAIMRSLDVFTVGRLGAGITLIDAAPEGLSQRLTLRCAGRRHVTLLPLAGAFQTANALVAAGLAIKTGGEPGAVFAALEKLTGAKGRLELVGRTSADAPIFIDYAHTPDALEKALLALRPYAAGRLIVVFGCGGDRDRGKRPLMGAVAARLADVAYVTDDNPRSEDAAAIRAQILAAAPGARDVGDRASAIAEAVAGMRPGDVLLVAGKGHETGQIVGAEVIPYTDHDAVRAALKALAPADGLAPESDAAPEPVLAQPEPAGAAEPGAEGRTAEAPATEPAAEAPSASTPPPEAAMSKADALPAPGVADATADQKSENEAAASTSVEQAVETPAPQNAPPPETPLPAAATSETPPEPPRDAPSAAPASKPQAEPEAPPPPAAPEIAPTPAAAGEPPSAPLWLFADILKATKGGLQGGKPEAVHGVSIDSRTLAPGDLFVAIKGERVNGHNYVSQALEKGAVAAVVVKDYFGAAGPLLRVPDPLEALNALARAARARTEAKIIAVTGSAGKTSTKEMLRLALGVQAATHASEKSYNNLWGVPLSLARMPKATKFGVFEIGMNHAGEITPLTRMVRPHVAIVTTVGPVHLEFFSGVDAIAEAKAEIFLGLEADGVAIINRDLPQYEILERRAKEAKARIVTFGEHSSADVRLVSIELFSDRSRATASVLGETLVSDIGAPGKHLALNSLAVLAAVKIAGGDADLASASLAAFHTPDGRGVRARFALNGGDVLLIDESYNANPSSMRAALAVLAAVPRAEHPRRVVALGDMLELGHAAPELHKALAGPIDEASVDVVFACGPHMRSLFDALPAARQGGYAPTAADLAPQLVEAVRPGDAVMVKGSLGSDTGALVGALKRNLSARASGGPASGTQ